jgi:hypothetical protein
MLPSPVLVIAMASFFLRHFGLFFPRSTHPAHYLYKMDGWVGAWMDGWMDGLSVDRKKHAF